jgi:hypothetical protein
MPAKTISIGPFSGVDNVHAPSAGTFQPPGELEKRLAALVTASDVDLDDEGWPTSRPGLAAVLAPTAALRGFSALGMLLVHDEDKILQVDLDEDPVGTTTIVSGLAVDDPVQFLEHEGQVFWLTTSYAGRITDSGVAKNWGLQVPPAPTLGTTTGTLPAGLYQVTVRYQDASGIGGAAPYGSAIAVNGTQAITVTLTPNDANATHVRIYATDADSDAFYWVKTVAVGDLPTTLTSCAVSLLPLKTHHMRGPIPGSGLFAFNRTIVTFRGHWAFPSHEYSQHVFDPMHEVLYVAAPIRAAAGVSGGFWLATERGLFFLRGDSLKNLTVTRKDYEYYARGTLILPGGKLPSLGTTDLIALFLNQNGPVACTSDGQMLQLTQDRYRVGSVVEKRASWVYAERGAVRTADQIFFSLSATTPEIEEFSDPSGSYSLVAEDEWTPILGRILDLEANAPPVGTEIGDVQIWDGTHWQAVTPAP